MSSSQEGDHGMRPRVHWRCCISGGTLAQYRSENEPPTCLDQLLLQVMLSIEQRFGVDSTRLSFIL